MTSFNTGSLVFFLCFTLILGAGACKSKQKLAEQQQLQIQAENSSKEKAILMSILNDDGKMTLAEKERLLIQAKGIGSNDSEVLDLLAQVEAQLSREKDSKPLSNQKEVVIEAEQPLRDRVAGIFNSIASANSTGSANNLIQEGMGLFSSPNALVLVIISKSGDIKDYDEPTNILKYLNYLKDQRSNPNDIYQVVLDDAGKIKELELIKK